MKIILVVLSFFSLSSCLPVDVLITPPVAKTDVYRATLKSGENEINLRLQLPEANVFHSNFKVLSVNNEENGNTVITDVTPQKNFLSQLEQEIFVDPSSNAAVKLVNERDGIWLYGEINGQMIYRNQDGQHELSDIPTFSSANDYVDPPGDQILKFAKPFSPSRLTTVTPEILLVVDNAIYSHFSGNVTQISEYFAIFIRGVNNRYATSQDPQVTFKIIGLIVMETVASQPFIENHKHPNGTYDMLEVLHSFGNYMYNAADNFLPHDTAALISNLNYNSVGGYAVRGGACRTNTGRSLKTSVNRDLNVSFAGVSTAAHELGHNLGAPHDGDINAGSGNCPVADGYIMSPNGGAALNRFLFSNCSKVLMKEYIESTSGSCMFIDDAPNSWNPSPLNPGDRVDMDAFCKSQTGRPDSVVSTKFTPDELCQNIRCQWSGPCSPPNEHLTCTWTMTTNRPPPDGCPCGTSGGTCQSGLCKDR